MASTIVIRRAVPDDLDWLVQELKAFSQFYGTKLQLFGDENIARRIIDGMMKSHVVFVAERSGDGLLGFVAGIFVPHHFNPTIKTLVESFWWVAEKFRFTRAGLLLLEAFISWGKHNADWIMFTLEHHSPVNERVLLNRGFKPQERHYLLEVG